MRAIKDQPLAFFKLLFLLLLFISGRVGSGGDQLFSIFLATWYTWQGMWSIKASVLVCFAAIFLFFFLVCRGIHHSFSWWHSICPSPFHICDDCNVSRASICLTKLDIVCVYRVHIHIPGEIGCCWPSSSVLSPTFRRSDPEYYSLTAICGLLLLSRMYSSYIRNVNRRRQKFWEDKENHDSVTRRQSASMT